MNEPKEPSRSLIVNLFLHPWKAVWRFFLLYYLIGVPVSWVLVLNNFFNYTKFGQIVYVIIIAYITLRLVRKSAMEDYKKKLDEYMYGVPESEKMKKPGAADVLFAGYCSYKRRQAMRDMEEEYNRRQSAAFWAEQEDINARWADKNGDKEAADYHSRNADMWRSMR